VGKLVKPLTPHQIYEKLRGGEGTPLLDEARAAAYAQQEAEHQRAELIRKQALMVQAGWEGKASESASGAVQPLVTNALIGSAQLSVAEKMMDRQSGSFHDAANSVRPVPPEPPQPDVSDPMWPFIDDEKRVADYQADAQHNIEVFRGYDAVSEGHELAMGEFATVDDTGGVISVTGDSVEYSEPGQRRDPGGAPSGGPPSDGSPVGGPPVDGPPISGPPDSGAGPGSQQPQQTSPNDFVPRPAGTSGPLPGSPTPTGQGPGGLLPGLPVGGFVAGGPGGMGDPGARGGGTGSPGGTGRGPGMRGGLLGAGPGVGALAAEEAAAQRAAAAAASRGGTGPGVLGGAPVGPNRTKDEEDDEHKRKILIESDSEGLFGSDELTAPQVIGDDAYEDD
jgi:hypothetical protein